MSEQMNDHDRSLEDRELPDESDMDGDDQFSETEPCPFCKQPIHEEVEICHHCGGFIDRQDPSVGRVPWITIGVIVCLIITIMLWLLE